MNYLFRQFIFIWVVCNIFASYAVAQTCNTDAIDCASIVNGVPTYSNSHYVGGDIDVQTAMSIDTYISVIVDITNWDLNVYGQAFLITSSKADYTLSYSGIYLYEKYGAPDINDLLDPFNKIKNDSVRDYFDNAYVAFEIDGKVNFDDMLFSNHGETIIAEGAEFYSSGTQIFTLSYAELWTIGGAGGTTIANISTPFYFRKIRMENAIFDLYYSSTVVPINVLITDFNRKIYMYGNVAFGLHGIFLHINDFRSKIDFIIEEDGNIITLQDSKVLWSNAYSEDQGFNMDFSCSGYCNQNGINLYVSQFAMNTLSLFNVGEMYINLTNNSIYNVEHSVLTSSNLIIDVDASKFMYSANSSNGSIEIDQDSSLIINAHNVAELGFYNTNIEVLGSLTMNIAESSNFYFYGSVDITNENNININFTSSSYMESETLNIYGDGSLYFNFVSSSGEFNNLNMYGGNLFISLNGTSIVDFDDNLNIEDGNMNFNLMTDSIATLQGVDLLNSDLAMNLSNDSKIDIYNDLNITSGSVSLASNNSSVMFHQNMNIMMGDLYVDMSEDAYFKVSDNLNVENANFQIVENTESTITLNSVNITGSNFYLNISEDALFSIIDDFVLSNSNMYIVNKDSVITIQEKATVTDAFLSADLSGSARLSVYEDMTFSSSEASMDLSEKGVLTFYKDLVVSNSDLSLSLNGSSQAIFSQNITGTNGNLVIDVKGDSMVYFKDTNIDTKVIVNQETYYDGTYQTMLRFDKVDTFLDDNFVYNYSVYFDDDEIQFDLNNPTTMNKLIILQIKNNGTLGTFAEEYQVIRKIDNVNATSFSVLLILGSGLVDYVSIGSNEYAEFGIKTVIFQKAEDQYGEQEGLLTLTTVENMNSYGVAVAFDNIVLNTSDKATYRTTLFNVVINNSRTVEQLGDTLNSLDANITLSNVLYSSTILGINEKKNTQMLLKDQMFTLYADMGYLLNDNFSGNYSLFSLSGAFFTSDETYKFGVSLFYSPYHSNTAYDLQEKTDSFGASIFAGIQIGENLGSLVFDIGFMRSKVEGMGIEDLAAEYMRTYSYTANSENATISYNIGEVFNLRIMVSAFAKQAVTYVENESDLALGVTTPSYYSVFAGSFAKMLLGENERVVAEFGIKYYFKEAQKGGIAGFMNDPNSQQWNYQYIMLDSPTELNLGISYKMTRFITGKITFNKRSSYNNLSFYVVYGEDDDPEEYLTDY